MTLTHTDQADRLYPPALRQTSREVYRRLNGLATRISESRRGGAPLREIDIRFAETLTGSVDPETQFKALNAQADMHRKEHIDRLIPLANDDFPIFCEVMSPDEPPTAPWLQFLTGKLMEIEYNPRLNNIILNVPPGHAKPLDVESLVTMATGSQKRLGDIGVGDKVLTHRGFKPVTATHEQGELDAYKLTTRDGRVIVGAADHPVMRPNGEFTDLAKLGPGDRLVLSRSERVVRATSRTRNHFIMAAFFDVTGYTNSNGHAEYLRFMCSAMPAIKRAQEAAEKLGWAVKCYPSKGRTGSQFVCTMSDWAEFSQHIKASKTLAERRMSSWVHQGSGDDVLAYLGMALDCRGETTSRLVAPALRMYAKSVDYLYDLQRLFWRIGAKVQVEALPEGCSGRHMLVVGPDALAVLYAGGYRYCGQREDALEAKIAARPLSLTSYVQILDTEGATSNFDEVASVQAMGVKRPMRCLTVEDDHTFCVEGVVVRNSTYASRLFPVWRMGRNPDLKVLGASHTQDMVEKEFSRKIRDMTQTLEFGSVFPDFRIDPASRANNQWNVLGTRGQYVARGVGQSIHGFRFNMAIVDDPYPSIAKARSAAYRGEVSTFVLGDIGTRMLPGGVIFLVMTRFHAEDVSQTLLDLNEGFAEAFKFDHISVPAICYDPETDPLGRQMGELLWDFYSYEHFQALRQKLGYNQFSLINQQITAAVSEDSIASHFQHYTVLPHLTKEALAELPVDPATGKKAPNRRSHFRRVVCSVDAANTDNERSDYSVVQVWGETVGRKHYLMDQVREKVDFNKLVELINHTAKMWEVDAILVEAKGNGLSYIQHMGRTDYQARKAPAPVVEIKVPGNQGKAIRLDSVSPMIEAKEVFVPINAPWCDAFMQEVGQFPDSAHDDQVDSMTQYLSYARSKRSRFGSKAVTSFG